MGRAPSHASRSGSSPSCTCCCNSQLRRGPWTLSEDELLSVYMKAHGDRGNWRKVPKAAGLARCGKSCRLRWLNYLRPDLKRGKFSEDEEELIIRLHSLLGNRWSLIAGRIPGRSDNEIKNHWNFHLGKRLRLMGINPQTHKPLLLQCQKSCSIDAMRSRTSSSAAEQQQQASTASASCSTPSSSTSAARKDARLSDSSSFSSISSVTFPAAIPEQDAEHFEAKLESLEWSSEVLDFNFVGLDLELQRTLELELGSSIWEQSEPQSIAWM